MSAHPPASAYRTSGFVSTPAPGSRIPPASTPSQEDVHNDQYADPHAQYHSPRARSAEGHIAAGTQVNHHGVTGDQVCTDSRAGASVRAWPVKVSSTLSPRPCRSRARRARTHADRRAPWRRAGPCSSSRLLSTGQPESPVLWTRKPAASHGEQLVVGQKVQKRRIGVLAVQVVAGPSVARRGPDVITG
jgi:hypothetical protein